MKKDKFDHNQESLWLILHKSKIAKFGKFEILRKILKFGKSQNSENLKIQNLKNSNEKGQIWSQSRIFVIDFT